MNDDDRLMQTKTDGSRLKADLTVLKADVAELKADMKEVRLSLPESRAHSRTLPPRKKSNRSGMKSPRPNMRPLPVSSLF